MIKKIVGKNIRYYRNQRGFSQKEAATLVGITSTYWGYLERGQKNPSIELVESISKVLGIKVNLLFLESPAEKLPEEFVHYLNVVNNMGEKHIDFILTIIKAYINVQNRIANDV